MAGQVEIASAPVRIYGLKACMQSALDKLHAGPMAPLALFTLAQEVDMCQKNMVEKLSRKEIDEFAKDTAKLIFKSFRRKTALTRPPRFSN